MATHAIKTFIGHARTRTGSQVRSQAWNSDGSRGMGEFVLRILRCVFAGGQTADAGRGAGLPAAGTTANSPGLPAPQTGCGWQASAWDWPRAR